MSDKKFGRYQMFQQFQTTQIISSSSTPILTQKGNSTVCFTFIVPSTFLVPELLILDSLTI